jgi:hypothetical protein
MRPDPRSDVPEMDNSRPGTDAVTTLNLVYEDLVRERDRLRDARRSVTSQLGPLPAASGVVIGLFGALGPRVQGAMKPYFIVALILLLVIAGVSTVALTSSPYRKLREGAVKDLKKEGWTSDDRQEEQDWLAAMIELERLLKVTLGSAFNKERDYLLAVQWLFVVQVLLLGAMVLVGP